MKKIMLAFLCAALLLFPAISQAKDKAPTEAKPVAQSTVDAPQERMLPVSFIVLDGTGTVNAAMRNDWMRMAKLTYHIPYYTFLTDNKGYLSATQLLGGTDQKTSNLSPALLGQIADEAGAKVVVLMVVHAMNEYLVHGGYWHHLDGPETYVRTDAIADLYVYKKDGDVMLRRLVRESNLNDLGQQEHPAYTIKYALNKLLSKMEGKEPI